MSCCCQSPQAHEKKSRKSGTIENRITFMKRGLKILLIAEAWAVLALGMIAPIYAIFVEKIGGDILDASWAYFAFMFTSGAVIFLISHWEDKVRHKEKLIMLGYVLTSVGCLLYIFVENQFALMVTQVLLGLAVAVKDPAYDALYMEYIDHRKEASEWGDWESMFYITTAVAAIVGGYFANAFGFKALFIFMFLTSVFSMATTLFLFKKKQYLNAT